MAELLPDIDTIIWDLDGTLIDSQGVMESCLAEILPARGFAVPTPDVVAANFHGSLEDTIRGILGADDEMVGKITQDFLRVQLNYYEAVDEHILPDALALAQRLQADGKRQILVTNRAHEGRLSASPRSIVASSALCDLISLVISGDDSEHRKPKPAVLGTVIAEIDPKRTVTIGDQFVDAEFAYNLGATSILVDRAGQGIPHIETLAEDAVYRIVRSLDEV